MTTFPDTPMAAHPRTMRLLDAPLVGLYPIEMSLANDFLVHAQHKLGTVNRPFHSEAYGLEVQGTLVGVAVSCSLISAHIRHPDGSACLQRGEVVELARLATTDRAWSRVLIRMWRELAAPLWPCWPVVAAVSYSHNAMHRGDLYRFDGWERWREDAGSSGGGSWSRPRHATEAVHGRKTVWVWRYQEPGGLPLRG